MNSEFTIAIHSLALLAYRPDHMATSDMIAHNVCTHPARVRKVMAMLRKNGYVAAKEGTGGGFILKCDPEQVTLAEMYRLTSMGSVKPGWCSGDAEQDCMIACNMATVMDQLYAGAEKQMIDYFGQWTIRDVLEQVRREQEKKPGV
ncbi:Rrf2 family transcriptional regulator [Paenibacillus doosanensis]|uniref:HTH-type transcriptional regulator YwnA n=1 Tax=Paenibacillus konkukensis TaxID=2020716 RepID=A0ABY4RSS8_9BACL|nr:MULTISPECIES: Rrf2 family transcriptional regulator [Paenibacillus]MCS7463777.1 Rrf2 family transcriptional regulator [Paenibacillus doosanensis]UQZ85275.1 Putative HTH-type transcriptional regulator YwnA [Paenibacillus konkukensis]